MDSSLYFDYCATTPLHSKVREAMLPTLAETYGNPSSMHGFGRKARAEVEKARNLVATGLGSSPEDIIFTSGATEANNLALIGTLKTLAPKKNHLIVSSIEHHAVLHTAEAMADSGLQVTYLPVDHQGLVSIADLESAIRPETGLVSIMMVNNEVGSLQDMTKICSLTRKKGVIFHTDAVQAVPFFEIDVEEMGVDLLSLSAHKMYGPKGVGALFIRKDLEISPLLFGGEQERKIRPGTENVPGIVGLGAAMTLRNDDLLNRRKRLSKIRKILIKGLQEINSEITINGAQNQTAPHVISASFPEVDGELLLFHLSQKGVAVSLGSACTSEAIEPSHVLAAMGIPIKKIEGTVRISIGCPTSEEDVKAMLRILPEVVDLSIIDN
jgi:cysteine desulfurase